MESSPRFADHFRVLISTMRCSGLATPWIKKPDSIFPRLPYLLWDFILTFIIIYMLACYVYTLMTISLSIQDLCGLGISTASFLYGFLLTLWHFLSSDDLKKITDKTDSIASCIGSTQLGHAESHLQLYVQNADFVKKLTLLAFRYSAFLPFIYYLTVPITDYITGDYRTRFPVHINSPFNDKLPGVYELIVLVMSSCVTSSYAKKISTDCLFVALFRIHADFLKYLSLSMTSFEKDFASADSGDIKKKLLLWIKLHQEIVTNIQKLVLIFSPVIIIYYVSMVVNIVCAAFILMKNDNDSYFQSALMLIYVTVAISYQFLLSNTASQITSEAQDLGDVAYNTPWYLMNKANAEIVRLVVTVSNTPISVTAYRSPVFLLNRETFSKFITTVVSAFVTLCQMKEIYDD